MTNEQRIARIRQLYYATTASTIQRDFARAVELARVLGSDAERERVAVYLDGLSQLRSEWAIERTRTRARKRKP